MTSISELEHGIRDIINTPRRQFALLKDHATWNMLCSCLDTIGDTELCLDAYLARKVEETEIGAQYLLVYGVLQALFLQQDAVTHLAEALQVPYTPNPILMQIREIRNDSAGHPTKRGGGQGKSYNFISRITLSSRSFQLITTFSDNREPRFSYVDIHELVAKQRLLLSVALNTVLAKLEKEDKDHKRMFNEVKLSEILPQSMGYHFEKVFEGIRNPDGQEYGALNLKFIVE